MPGKFEFRECIICHKMTNNLHMLRHMLKCDGWVFVCRLDGCGRIITQNDSLNAHSEKMHGGKYAFAMGQIEIANLQAGADALRTRSCSGINRELKEALHTNIPDGPDADAWIERLEKYRKKCNFEWIVRSELTETELQNSKTQGLFKSTVDSIELEVPKCKLYIDQLAEHQRRQSSQAHQKQNTGRKRKHHSQPRAKKERTQSKLPSAGQLSTISTAIQSTDIKPLLAMKQTSRPPSAIEPPRNRSLPQSHLKATRSVTEGKLRGSRRKSTGNLVHEPPVTVRSPARRASSYIALDSKECERKRQADKPQSPKNLTEATAAKASRKRMLVDLNTSSTATAQQPKRPRRAEDVNMQNQDNEDENSPFVLAESGMVSTSPTQSIDQVNHEPNQDPVEYSDENELAIKLETLTAMDYDLISVSPDSIPFNFDADQSETSHENTITEPDTSSQTRGFPSASTSQPDFPTTSDDELCKWSQEQVQKWLRDVNLGVLCKKLIDFDGEALGEYRQMLIKNPQLFFEFVDKNQRIRNASAVLKLAKHLRKI